MTMRIKSLANQPDRAGRYRVVLEDDSVLRLYRQTLEDHRLYPGMELESEALEKLRQDASAMSAKMRAVRIVTASSVSKGDLERRLIQKGENPAQARDAVQWMEDLELLDDRRTAEQVVSSCIRKGYGLARARQALYEKRIPKQYWQEALEDYPDQLAFIQDYLRQHLGPQPEEKALRKATDALLRRGHSYGTIRKALGQLTFDEEYPEEPWEDPDAGLPLD